MIDLVLFDDGNIYHNPKITDLYGHRQYSNPKYSEWQYWYAWYPVIVLTWSWVPIFDRYLKTQKILWLTPVLKRTVDDQHTSVKSIKVKVFYEYTTMDNALKFS
jgi:hypothetical protein